MVYIEMSGGLLTQGHVSLIQEARTNNYGIVRLKYASPQESIDDWL